MSFLLGLFLENPWVFLPYHAFPTRLGLLIVEMPEGMTLSIIFASISYPFRLFISPHSPSEEGKT